jgi:hypothetical protein
MSLQEGPFFLGEVGRISLPHARGRTGPFPHTYQTHSKSGKTPDVFRCGPGRLKVHHNKGLDKVADDCEVLRPAPL